MNKNQPPMTFLTDSQLDFEFDPDTGLLWVTISAGTSIWNPTLGKQQDLEMPVRLALTPKASRLLLGDIRHLETLLLQASEGPTKPRSVQ